MSRTRTRKHRSASLLKKITRTSSQALPFVEKGLTNVGMTAKGIAYKSKPVLEKGVSVVYKTIATGFDLGLKGTKSVAKGVSSFTKKRRHSRRFKRRHSSRRH